MSLKKLAGETMIYGVSSILGRILNFALVPLYTDYFSRAAYGKVSYLFSIIGFLMVFFTYRMEVAYFRFGTDKSLDRRSIFNTSFTSIFFSTILLALIFSLLAPTFAHISSLDNYLSYIYLSIGIILLDTFCELPYAELRLQGRPIRFATIRMCNIFVNLGLNLFFIVACPWFLEQESFSFLHPFINSVYNPDIGIGYIFIANFAASSLAFLLLSPTFKQFRFLFDWQLWLKMMRYVLPLVVVGIAYLINENLDKILIKTLLPGSVEENEAALGEYSACYKLAVLIALFTQAFRYGAEPFFFRNKNQENAKQLYASVAKYFLIFGVLGFLCITLYLDLFKPIIIRNEAYWAGLKIVPIILVANVLAGLYYNFSVWYKITDKTQWGAYISVGGALITILLNIWWIPTIGYIGSAWATLICYTFMTLACYLLGQKYYPISYPLFSMLSYLIIGIVIYLISQFIKDQQALNLVASLGLNTLLLILFLAFVYKQEHKNIRAILKGQ
jgi:O-antigen/teichoic acid export membrane protein